MKDRICGWCGEIFEETDKESRYCSVACLKRSQDEKADGFSLLLLATIVTVIWFGFYKLVINQ